MKKKNLKQYILTEAEGYVTLTYIEVLKANHILHILCSLGNFTPIEIIVWHVPSHMNSDGLTK